MYEVTLRPNEQGMSEAIADLERRAIERYIAKVNTALDRYFEGPHEDWRSVASDMAQILMDAADER